MTGFNTPGEFAGLVGNGLTMPFGNSIILIAIALILITAFLMWKYRATMQETYIVVFLEMAFLRLYFNDSSFSDIGIFGMLHNLMLLGSALVLGKLLTSSPGR